jgi:hypothetical protein
MTLPGKSTTIVVEPVRGPAEVPPRREPEPEPAAPPPRREPATEPAQRA